MHNKWQDQLQYFIGIFNPFNRSWLPVIHREPIKILFMYCLENTVVIKEHTLGDGYHFQFSDPPHTIRSHNKMLIKINPENPQKRLLDKVVATLKKGGIIAYPTDTFYGIGCDIMNKKAIEKIYLLRQRDKRKPFSFICSGLTHISRYAKVSNYAYKTMRRLLPGPYTFILEGSKLVPKIMLTKRKTAGIRVPANKICLELVEALGNPIISTSAKDANETEMNDPSLIHDHFGNMIDMVVDGGQVPGHPSSVISLSDDIPEIIREGIGDVGLFS
jgi:tRNA threonylcarbamoyl adenosine modification protein (Sua5/YciO/YrdC/YwlC family)